MWIRWCDRVIDKYKALCWWKKGKWWQVICYISFSNKFNVHQVVIANLLISYTYISFLLSCVLKCILYWLSFSVIELNITVTFISWWWELYYTTIKVITIRHPPHTHTHKKKSYFLKGIDWRKCDFSRRIDFFFKLWNEMSRGFRRGETWHSPGYTTFCWSPVRWLSRLPRWRII